MARSYVNHEEVPLRKNHHGFHSCSPAYCRGVERRAGLINRPLP
jgi:hypothetical protein